MFSFSSFAQSHIKAGWGPIEEEVGEQTEIVPLLAPPFLSARMTQCLGTTSLFSTLQACLSCHRYVGAFNPDTHL